MASNEETSYDELFPHGRIVFYEGDDPDRFAAEMAALGIDVRYVPDDGGATPDWDRLRSFYIPPGRVEEIYIAGRWALGS
jgi:hypothetical protein